MSVLVCGGLPTLPQAVDKALLEEITSATSLTPAEVKALYARFRRLAPLGQLMPEQFRQTMGVLGLTGDPFLPDRMFRVFDTDQDGKLSFKEFATSLATMIRGTEDEKLTLSFQMAAGHREAQGVRLEDFQQLVAACNTMMASLIAPTGPITTPEDAERLFNELASGESDEAGEAILTLEEYKRAAQMSEEFLACLGLETYPRRGRRMSNAQTSAPQALSQLNSVPISQVEELQKRIAALRDATASAQAQILRRQPAKQEASTREQQILPLPRAAQDCSKAPWWLPLCGCKSTQESPSERIDATSEGVEANAEEEVAELPVTPNVAAGSRLSEEQALLQEIHGELDGIYHWCERHTAREGNFRRNQTGAVDRRPGGAPRRSPEAEAHEPARTGEGRRATQIPTLTAIALRAQSPEAGAPVSNANHRLARFGEAGRRTTRMPTLTAIAQRAQNWTKRRHRLLGPKKGLAVHFGHENWNMVLSMMIGIRMSVGRSKHEVARELQPVDFIMKEKFSIIPRLANIFDSAASKHVTVTRFIDYAPLVFQKIRASFGINQDDYLRSVGPEQLLGNMVLGNLSSLSELSSEGKSGAFFYYTADGQYMMKTVTPKEHQLLFKMLKRYYDHITHNPNTLIVRFLGLHSLRVQNDKKGFRKGPDEVHFVVMGNMFNTPLEIHRRYDLKGSWIGRVTPADVFDPTVALKDVDFTQSKECIRIGEERKKKLIAQIESDSVFLRDNNIIDYSLLLGICELNTRAPTEEGSVPLGGHDNDPVRHGVTFATDEEVPMHQRDMGGMLSTDRKVLYFLGIIDILTPYDTIKKLEHLFKSLKNDRRGISCCPPAFYAERFSGFMRDAIG